MPVLERIAIVDDTTDMREEVAYSIEQRKLTPVFIVRKDASVADLVAEIQAKAEMALCDQRLASMTTQADGARVVEALTSKRFPAILYSQQKTQDAPVLRHFYPKIPRYVTRAQLSAIDFARAFSEIENEFDAIPNARRTYRTLVRVEDLNRDRAWVEIPSWRLHEQVEISLTDIDAALRPAIKNGTRLFAEVNLHATAADDVYLTDFELAPEPRGDDGFA